MGSDDQRFFHDHPWDFVAILIKGSYMEIVPDPSGYKLAIRRPWEWRYYPAEYQHMVKLDRESSVWSIVLSWPKRRNFGYWVNGHLMRPFRYFSRYKVHPCE